MKNKLYKYSMALSTGVVALFSQTGAVIAQSGIDIGDTKLATGFAKNLGSVITGVLQFVMAIAALAVFLYLIYGGIQWITSGGEKGKVEEARNKITSAVIGLIVLAAAYAVLQIMLRFLGLNDISGAFEAVKPLPGGGETI